MSTKRSKKRNSSGPRWNGTPWMRKQFKNGNFDPHAEDNVISEIYCDVIDDNNPTYNGCPLRKKPHVLEYKFTENYKKLAAEYLNDNENTGEDAPASEAYDPEALSVQKLAISDESIALPKVTCTYDSDAGPEVEVAVNCLSGWHDSLNGYSAWYELTNNGKTLLIKFLNDFLSLSGTDLLGSLTDDSGQQIYAPSLSGKHSAVRAADKILRTLPPWFTLTVDLPVVCSKVSSIPGLKDEFRLAQQGHPFVSVIAALLNLLYHPLTFNFFLGKDYPWWKFSGSE